MENKSINIKSLVQDYESGTPSTALSKKHKVSTQKVLKMLRDNGVKIRSKGGTVKKYDEGWTQHFVNAYINGEPISEIAQRMGVGYGTVMRGLKNVKKRPNGLRKQTISMPVDPYIVGYIAGLFDGEGNLQLKCKNKGNYMQCKLSIYNTNLDVMEWLKRQIPGSKLRWDKKRTETYGWLPCGIWELYRARDVKVFLDCVIPYLIIKSDAAKTALALFKDKFSI